MPLPLWCSSWFLAYPKFLAVVATVVLLIAPFANADEPGDSRGSAAAQKRTPIDGLQSRREFSTLVAHWAEYADSDYLPFLEAARPDVAQVGFYGAHFWSLAHTPHGKGYPAHFPKVGLAENRDWLSDLNREIHRLGIQVVGHLNVKFLVGDPDSPKTDSDPGGPRGFFKFYADYWNTNWLGARPTVSALDLLEVDASGKPLVNNSYSIGGMKEYWGCLNNPNWRAVLKAWVKHGIDLGCDGFIANYFYRHNCLCPHCQSAFKAYLRERFSAEDLRSRFGISQLDSHVFPEIVSWHKPEDSTPLRREMLRFSQVANKRAFDEVLVNYGRSLKPDLLVAQWNHLGNFNQLNGDERCLLPSELWGREENYLWYSTGDAANFTDLAEGILGEGTLQARYLRGMFGNRPFTLGKYEGTRIRVAIAELAANGGAPMGFYTRFTDPAARREIVRYYRFVGSHPELFREHQPQHEALLLFPRKAVLEGDLSPLERFRREGLSLLDEHLLFDVRPDDALTPEIAARYRQVLSVATDLRLPELRADRSRIQGPRTVRVSLSKHSERREFALHLVNYQREEPVTKRSPGGGIQDEKPLAVADVRADLLWSELSAPTTVEFLTPELTETVPVEFSFAQSRLQFTVPKFLVYGVVRIR